MMTMGFGDILAKNNKEVFFVSFLEILSVLILAYIISVIIDLFRKLRAYRDTRSHNLVVINRYMRNNHVPFDIQADIK
jgi:hypothetical protein